jgi:hypothetical protein
MKKTVNRVVILGDVVRSRQIRARKKFESRLAAAVQEAAQQYSDAFDLPLKTWKGLDEIAAVLKKPAVLYPIINGIQNAIAPERMRFVMVRDAVDIVPANRDVTQADGPAFHRAAALMTTLKAKGLLFEAETGDAVQDKALNSQMNLLLLLKQDWTEKQRQIYNNYLKTGRQEEVARQLKVTQQSVSKTLKAIHAFQVQQLEAQFLSWCAETMNQ